MAKRVLLGKKGSEYVLQVSKPGVDVTGSVAPRDLLFNTGTVSSGTTSGEKSFRSGVINSNTTITTITSGSKLNLPSTLGSDNNYYIPAYVITENGVRNPKAGYDESRNVTGFALYEVESDHTSGLPTNSGGGLWELTTGGSGNNINAIEAKQVDATQYENAFALPKNTYPFFADRGITSANSVSVDILMLRIPCQYGKMTIDALFNTTNQLSITASGGGGTGGTTGAPTITNIARLTRNNTNDTYRVTASAGSGNSGAITYAQSASTSTDGLSFQSSTDFTQARNSTKYYWAKQGGVVSTSAQNVSAAVDSTPSSFSFTTKNDATAGQNFSQASTTIAGLGDGDSAAVSVSGGTVNVSSVVNGGTVTATGTAASAGNATTVTVTIGGVQGTFTINTPAPASDTTPNAFSFTNATGSNASTVNTSNTINISGINAAANVTASGNGTVSVNGGSYTNSTTITNGQSINVRLTSSGSLGTGNFVETTINIGGTATTWRVTNRAAAAAVQPTGLTLTQTTNTSGTSQTVTATGSGGQGTIQVSNDNSTFHSNGHSFSQNRSGSTTTYYTRTVTADQTSSNRTATKLVPPVISIASIANFVNRSSNGESSSFSTDYGGNKATYQAHWGTIQTTMSSSDTSWLTVSVTNSSLGYFTINAGANGSTSSRNANITYTISTQFGYQHSFTFNFQQNGVALDSTPNQFTFGSESSANLGQTYTKSQTLSGMNTTATAVYSGDANGTFSIDNSTFNQSNKTVQNGTVLYLRIPASGSFSTARSAAVTVSGISSTMTVTTQAQDTDVNDFDSFQDETGALTNTVSTSNAVTVNGFNGTLTASFSTNGISGFKVGSGSFSTSSKSITNGQTITMFIRSSTQNSTTTTSTVTVGNKNGTFRVTTTSGGGGGEGGGLE